MSTSTKRKTVKIEVEKTVKDRLLKYGATPAQQVKNLMNCNEVILHAVRRPLDRRKSICVTPEDRQTLQIAQETLGCQNLSNVIESMLNTNPTLPEKVKLSTEVMREKVSGLLRVKPSDHKKLRNIAEKECIPLWMVVHNLLENQND